MRDPPPPPLALRRLQLMAVMLSMIALSTASSVSFVLRASAQNGCPATLQCTILDAEKCTPVVPGAALDASTLTKFLDDLPRPAVAKPVASRGRLDPRFCSGGRGDKPADCPALYHFTLAATKQQLHKDLPPTSVYGYSSGGPGATVTYPGSTIEARSNVPIQVRWENRLPRCHLLPLDPTVAEMDSAACELLRTQSRAVTHLHGGRTEAQSDGHPEAVSEHTDTAQAEHRRSTKGKEK